MSAIKDKLNQLGYTLPEAPVPVASYISVTQVGNLVYTSGTLPMENGKIKYTGKINNQNYETTGYEAAKLCTLNALSILDKEIDLDNIKKFVKLTGFVNSESGFIQQPKVINGSSDLLVEVFEEAGKHTRSAVGVSDLPLDVSVEIEFIVEIK